MNNSLTIQIDESFVMDQIRRQINEMVKEADAEYIYWDAKELMRRTCMSWNFIQEQFFFNPGFPKHKIGKKWYFPVRETRAFLEDWIRKQPT